MRTYLKSIIEKIHKAIADTRSLLDNSVTVYRYVPSTHVLEYLESLS